MIEMFYRRKYKFPRHFTRIFSDLSKARILEEETVGEKLRRRFGAQGTGFALGAAQTPSGARLSSRTSRRGCLIVSLQQYDMAGIRSAAKRLWRYSIEAGSAGFGKQWKNVAQSS
jgi:hypothetical protein